MSAKGKPHADSALRLCWPSSGGVECLAPGVRDSFGEAAG
jgi:hypothetical protein